jgi:hypothetical protein
MIAGKLHICDMCYSITRSARQMVLSHCTDMYILSHTNRLPLYISNAQLPLVIQQLQQFVPFFYRHMAY